MVESREAFEEAPKLSIRHDQTRANALIGLGVLESHSREWEPAIEHFREALALSREIRASTLEALALRDLGNTYAELGDFASAQPLLRRALAIFETTPQTRTQHAATLVSLGVVYNAENKLGLAEAVFVQALKRYGSDAEDPRSVLALQYLAMIRAQQKRFTEAADLANRGYATAKSAFGESSGPAAQALGTLAFVEEKSGDLEHAERDYSSAVRIVRDARDLDSTSASRILSGYASLLRKLHRQREAKKIEQRVKAFRARAQ